VAQMAPAARARAVIWRCGQGVCWRMFWRFWRDQRGASLIDCAILAALITVLVVVGVAFAGSWIYSMWVQLLPRLW
jgi:Flp pilus assembly pilin Flp